MPRPKCCRRIGQEPSATIFKPLGVPARMLEEVVMTLDESEALRLVDHERLYQEEAARRMGVSRATFGRVLGAARGKVAEVLVFGKMLRIEGGAVTRESASSSPSDQCPRRGRKDEDCHSDVGK